LPFANTIDNPQLSIVIPTYNEADNIIQLLESIKANVDHSINAEIIVVDDNSPDGTGKLVDQYIEKLRQNANVGQPNVRVIHRKCKKGLVQAIQEGIEFSEGKQILIMDADFSHPPDVLPRIVDKVKEHGDCIIVASRYVEGGRIKGWPLRRRLLSLGANTIARSMLDIGKVKDPMSGFFVLPKKSIENIEFNTRGYKLLMELLVKARSTRILEIPYTFTDRKAGKSKLSHAVILDYFHSLLHLYMHGKKSPINYLQGRDSIKFFSKAGRFFTVGLSGLLVNYLLSVNLSNGSLAHLWYMQSTFIGILVSITTNFIINKMWTFEDKDFSLFRSVKQYLTFLAISSLGASLQLGLVYILTESRFPYEISLLLSVLIAAFVNFILNKKFTFKEKVWG
jgi:dolichol-phosphate mannosyltransferase